MATKLKLVFRSQKLKLALKALIFAGLLFLAGWTGFNPLPISLFLVGAVFLYASPLFKTVELIKPFAVLLVVSLWSFSSVSGWFSILALGYLGALFYLLLGVKEIVFLQRATWYRVLNVGLAYSLFLLFFYHGQATYWLRAILLFLALILLLGDFLKKRPVYWLLALVLLEIAWALGLLPIGFIGAANLALLVYFILVDFVRRQVDGELTKRVILINVTLFTVLLIVVFGLSRWGL